MWLKHNCILMRGFIYGLPTFRALRYLNSKIPTKPFVLIEKNKGSRTKIDRNTIAHLERLSLVDFGNEKGVKILEDAIDFADQLSTVNTDGVEPLITVLEDRELRLRDDVVNDGNIRSKILSNATVTEEDYFVAPPGNIPLTQKNNPDQDISQDSDTEFATEKLHKKRL